MSKKTEILEKRRKYFEDMLSWMERKEKRTWKIYTISMLLIVLFEVVFILWTNSVIVGFSLGLVIGLWVNAFMNRKIRKEFK